VGQLKDPTATRTREGDEVVQVTVGSTRALVAFFTNFGSAYVTRINDVTPSTGYGDPVQKLFKFKDGERVVGMLSLDPRLLAAKNQMMLAVTKKGFGVRFELTPHTEVSTRTGRRFAKTAEGDEILGVVVTDDKDFVVVATSDAHGLACAVKEINVLAGPGRGVTVIKVEDDARVLGFASVSTKHEGISVESEKGKVYELTPKEIGITARGGKGHMFSKRDGFAKVLAPPVMIPALPEPPGTNGTGGGGQGKLVN
jgi:DNA gyrase subunit A